MELTTEQLSFGYIDKLDAVHEMNLRLTPGEFTGIVGPNGSGKTTLLKLLSGALKPRSGRVLVDGTPLTQFSSRQLARKIAVVPQSSHIAFNFTALDIVMMGRHAHIGRFQTEGEADTHKARSAMAAVGVFHLRDRLVSTLSGGEWQRVIIARALCQETPILLLDEPVANLDIRHQVEALSLIRQTTRAEGLITACVMHDLDLAAHYCDRLLLMDKGGLLRDGSPDSVLTSDNIHEAYGVRVQIKRIDGELSVVPEYAVYDMLPV